MTSINDLPNEVLLQIFQHVPNKKELTLTCRRWNVLISPTLRLKIDLTFSSKVDKLLQMSFHRPYQHLTIYGVMLMRPQFSWVDTFLCSKRARCETDPYEIVRKCLELTRQLEPHLTELKLSLGPMVDKIVTAFLPRGPGPSRLETLKIAFNGWYLSENPQDCAIKRLVSLVAKDDEAEVIEMPNLRKFHYQDTRSNGDRTIRRKFFDTIVRKAKGITEIKLQCTSYACFPDFRIMRSFSKQLQHVSCVIWPFFTEDLFQLTFPRAQSMDLCFDSCRSAPDTAANFFANALCLTDLVVSNVHNSEFFRQSVSKCPQLEKLTINGHHEIAMDGIQNLCRLKELNLYSPRRSIEQNAVPCSQTLEKFVLDRCTVGSAFYSELAINVPYLVELHIAGDKLFDDECLQAVCSSMVNLRRLKLVLMSFVDYPVTDDGFLNIDRLGKLEYLYLESFDSDFLTMRGAAFSSLFTDWVQKVTASRIHLKDFNKFPISALLNFVVNPNLKELVLDYCGNPYRLEDGMKKLRQLKNDIPNVIVINDDW